MPIKSKAQLEWLQKNRPDLLEEFLKDTKNVDKLPERLKPKKQIEYSGKPKKKKNEKEKSKPISR